MTKTVQRHEVALELDDLDVVVGGSASPMTYHPIVMQAPGTIPGAGFSPIYAMPSASNNAGLANHLDLMFPGMAHDDGHAAQGIAPGMPGDHGAPSLAAQDTQPHGGCHGAAGTDDHGAQTAASPLSLMPGVPGEPASSAASATAAAPAPADAGAALYFGLPGGTDAAHADTSHPATNDWAPGSFSEGAPASSTTDW
ncbi:MAG TPA: hypothetical protein VHW23_18085 [Kofleriaceae bacterium]|jgi:hypothetical protein|nr:hypothetical protein [Kofleriaceae bacterium]